MIRRMKWLSDVVCDNIGNLYDIGKFIDGKNTGTTDRNIKRNQELVGDEDSAAQKLFLEQFWKEGFASSIFTRRITNPMFIKYSEEEELDGKTVGGFYGFHNDAPIMGKENPVRSDYVMITGINDCSDYDGGGLLVRLGSETYEYRLGKGEAVFFDPNMWHSVKPVTKGERRVCIMWVETLIQDVFIRELLYEYQDLQQFCLDSIDMNHWQPDIDPQAYLNSIKYKLVRQYSNTY